MMELIKIIKLYWNNKNMFLPVIFTNFIKIHIDNVLNRIKKFCQRTKLLPTGWDDHLLLLMECKDVERLHHVRTLHGHKGQVV